MNPLQYIDLSVDLYRFGKKFGIVPYSIKYRANYSLISRYHINFIHIIREILIGIEKRSVKENAEKINRLINEIKKLVSDFIETNPDLMHSTIKVIDQTRKHVYTVARSEKPPTNRPLEVGIEFPHLIEANSDFLAILGRDDGKIHWR